MKLSHFFILWMAVAVIGFTAGNADTRTNFYERLLPPSSENAIVLLDGGDTENSEFADWHWPVPAGEWQIARGPCGFSGSSHECGNYQDKCSFDIAPKASAPKVMPVLAPYDGWVIFTGRLDDVNHPGVAAAIEHPDGRTSVYYQMSKVVVDISQWVAQGSVIGYVDTSKDTSSALHFFIQPNPVEHKCTQITGVDFIHEDKLTLVSFNTLWSMLTFTNPPPNLLDALPPVIVEDVAERYETRIRITPNQRVNIWIMLIGKLKNARVLHGGDKFSTVIKNTNEGALFRVSIESYAARTGSFPANFWPQIPSANSLSFSLGYEIIPAINLIPNNGILADSPKILQPIQQSKWKETPTFCWEAHDNGEKGLTTYRVRIVGTYKLDSGWITETCWRPHFQLPRGSYVWKVIARDNRGYMNPINQDLHTFRIVDKLTMKWE